MFVDFTLWNVRREKVFTVFYPLNAFNQPYSNFQNSFSNQQAVYCSGWSYIQNIVYIVYLEMFP